MCYMARSEDCVFYDYVLSDYVHDIQSLFDQYCNDHPNHVTTGSARPTITPRGLHLVIPLNIPFSLLCQGDQVVQWQREDRPKLRGEERTNGASVLKIPRAQPGHMGRYICLEEKTGEQSSIYVYVKGVFLSESTFIALFACVGMYVRVFMCIRQWFSSCSWGPEGVHI